MKNQARVSAPSAPVSPLSVAYSNTQANISRPVEITGHISLPAEFYEKYKESEVFQKGLPRVEFYHTERMIHLTAGEGDQTIYVVGRLTTHAIYEDLKVFHREWMPSKEADIYFEDRKSYFGPKHEGYQEVSETLDQKKLASISCFDDFKLHLPIFNEVPMDVENGNYVWLEMGTQPDLTGTSYVYFMSSQFAEMAQKVKDEVFAEQRERLKDLICIDIY
ncbi:hypothetical protein [Siphonobacter sp.]|uniref:hypothetical protein n=1 Tax=Siphonobacter sp. TaxID=1869184 RepID=UPI003B3A78F6